MSKNLNYPSNQAPNLIIGQQVFHPISYSDGANRLNTPADYLFYLVSYFKESNSLPKELLHQLQKIAEQQEREDQAIAHENSPIDYINTPSSTRHLRFNDFFTLNFNT
ncbi:MAG: hypothetical protein IPO03_19280 [Bacteroidetes bacterium]|nr:hypothetical protein [Bacteroidota bacterium]